MGEEVILRTTQFFLTERLNRRSPTITLTGRGEIEVLVEVADRRYLDRLVAAIQEVDGVGRVERKTGGAGRAERGR